MGSGWGVNPLALAQLITGESFQDETWTQAGALLEKAFQVKAELIFDSDGANPPRLKLFQDLASALRRPRRLAEIERLPLVREAMRLYGPDKVHRILPYLLPVSDAMFVAPGIATPDGALVGGYQDIGDKYMVKGVSYLDPVQGNAQDCYLISAMIALAWSRPAEWTERVRSTIRHSGGATTYRYAFFRGPDALDPPFAVEPRVWLSNAKPAYARSADAAEGWVPMFEKAFVMRKGARARKDPLPSDYQRISDDRMKPQIACRTLAGGKSHAADHIVLGGRKTLAATVGERCDARRVTREPTMAWTWPDVQMMGSLGWKTTGLVANHAYAVLGILCKGDRDYVVLRNPWERSPEPDGGYARGTWKPGAGPNGSPEVELNRNSVFAIRADWFDKCFAHVGWVER